MRQTCAELLAEFEARNASLKAEKISFTGVGERDVYNITAPFRDEGELVIAGRVEPRCTEESEAVFFVRKDGTWHPHPKAPVYALQDPFVARIRGELIFGGVETYPDPAREGGIGWRTRFYRGRNINSLECFAVGPDGMKDIRLVELDGGRVGVFTRPQGRVGGRGQIGFIIIESLNDLDARTMEQAELLDLFISSEWGGANEVHRLRNGLLGVLGHIARFDETGNRHYYSVVFAFDPEKRQASPMKIIAARKYLPAGAAKRSDLEEVIFSGGLLRRRDGRADLYVGVSDAEAHRVTMPDPFLEYEENLRFSGRASHSSSEVIEYCG